MSSWPARRRRAPVWALLALAHALLLLGWQHALQRPGPALPPPPRISWLQLLPAGPTAEARASTPRPTRPVRTREPRAPVSTRAIATAATAQSPGGRASSLPVTPPPKPAQEADSTPVWRSDNPLMDSPATRQAIRDAARGPLLSERAASVTAELPRTAGQGLTDQVHGALTADCSKGQFALAGMGLLSLPFLVLAEVRGRCAR